VSKLALGYCPFSAATITVTGYRPLSLKSSVGRLVFPAAIGGSGVTGRGAATTARAGAPATTAAVTATAATGHRAKGFLMAAPRAPSEERESCRPPLPKSKRAEVKTGRAVLARASHSNE